MSARTDTQTPSTAYVGLGANLGDAADTLGRAINALGCMPQTHVLRASSLYISTPVEAEGPDYVNAVACLQTFLTPHRLLESLQAVEQAHGRARPWRNAPRTLDLDLLLYNDCVIQTPTLVVPHPRMLQRAFVLVPLHEIAPLRVRDEALAQVRGQRCIPLASLETI